MGYLDNTGLAYFWGKLQAILANKANTASPALTGTPTAPTATAGTNNTQLATTAFVQTAIDQQEILDAASGKLINVQNAKAGAQIKELTLLNSSGGQLTGKSLVITNKNLFRIDLIASSTTDKGVTFTKNADGSISASGTSTGTYAATKCNIDKNAFVVGKTYTMYSNKTSGILYMQLALTYSDGTTDYLVSSNSPATFTIKKTVTAAVGSVQITASGANVNQSVWPQIEVGAAATSFKNNIYNAITYPSGAMPTLPDTISNVYSNDDTVSTIEMTYVQDISSALKTANERVSNLEAQIAELNSETVLVAGGIGDGTSPEEQLEAVLEDRY